MESQYPMEVVEADNLCPKCGLPGYAIYRCFGSDLQCENKHSWNYEKHIKREFMSDGRMHVRKVWYTVIIKEDLK
jgi:hypothetical protein